MTQPTAYNGPYLTWAGKQSSAASASQPDVASSRTAAADSEFAAWPAPAAGAPRLHPTRATIARASYVAPPHAYTPAAKRRAASVAAYVAPPIHRSQPAQIAASAPPAADAPTQAPVQALAQNDTPAAPAAANQTTGVQYYSLHREYGLTPDPVATPAERPMVLIGPPDPPTPQKPDDADDNGPSAQHGGAAGADE